MSEDENMAITLKEDQYKVICEYWKKEGWNAALDEVGLALREAKIFDLHKILAEIEKLRRKS